MAYEIVRGSRSPSPLRSTLPPQPISFPPVGNSCCSHARACMMAGNHNHFLSPARPIIRSLTRQKLRAPFSRAPAIDPFRCCTHYNHGTRDPRRGCNILLLLFDRLKKKVKKKIFYLSNYFNNNKSVLLCYIYYATTIPRLLRDRGPNYLVKQTVRYIYYLMRFGRALEFLGRCRHVVSNIIP